MGYVNHSEYVSIAMEFQCNLKCVHCMIEGTMNSLLPESFENFKEIIDHNAKHQQWKGIILTGSEITLHHDLPKLAVMARKSGFEHVHIQTHGMHLSHKNYCEKLVVAGVDEFFISVAGPDAASHDKITGVPGSFERTLDGLQNLEVYNHVVSITNTVVTNQNYQFLPAIVERLKHLEKLVQMEFWMYWPMSERDEKNLIAANAEILPYLKEAITAARSFGRQVEIKNFPACLLGDDKDLLVNSQPQLFIDPAFWPEFMRNGFHECFYREECTITECLGLNAAYIEKFGRDKDQLYPIR